MADELQELRDRVDELERQVERLSGRQRQTHWDIARAGIVAGGRRLNPQRPVGSVKDTKATDG